MKLVKLIKGTAGTHRRTALALAVLALAAFCMAWDVLSVGSPFVFVRIGPYLALVALCLSLLTAVREKWVALIMIPTIGLVLICVSTAWHPRKQFVQDLYLVKPGMLIGEVDNIMADYYQNPQPSLLSRELREGRGAETCVTYRWSDKAAFDADIGFVNLRSGKVVHIEFSPD